MSTEIELLAFGAMSTVSGNEALIEAASEFRRIAQTFTRFSEKSELSVLNRNSGSWFPVGTELLSLIEKGLEFAEFTDGRFDPTIIDALEDHGYSSSFNPQQIKKVYKKREKAGFSRKNGKTWRDISLDKENLRVKFPEGMRWDLGGYGKGYAIDRAAEILRTSFDDFLISAGGDVYGYGKNQEKGQAWTVELLVPDVNSAEIDSARLKTLGKISLNPSGQALASSGSWVRMVGDFHHLLDAETGKPSTKGLQTFVIHRSALTADALATSLFLCGEEIIDSINSEYQAQSLCLTNQGKIFASSQFSI